MLDHPSDDDLILHAYGESRPVDAQRIDEHVRGCAQCHAVWTDLRETLLLVDAADVPEPGPGFERIVWARVQQELFSQRSSRWSVRQWLPLAGLAAAAIAVTSAVVAWQPSRNTDAAPVNAAADSKAGERVLLTALDGHLEQTELLLIELLNAPDGDASIAGLTFERAAAEELVSTGRLYRVTAHHQGDLRLAQVLEDLEPVLVDLARSPERVDRQSLESIRARIDDESLLFKVRTAAHEIRERQQHLITVSEGPL